MTNRSAGAILQQLKRARRADLMTSNPGRADGQLTSKATKILEHIVPGAPQGLSSLP